MNWFIDSINSLSACRILRTCSRKTASFTPVLFFVLSFNSLQSAAVETQTLPVGIYSSSFRYGQINGLEQRYTETGSLMRLADYKSIEFDAKTLALLDSRADALIASLNRFGAFNFGDALNMGTLQIHTKPEVRYMAPVLARGITKNWSIGLGIPVIRYVNNVKLAESFSNIEYYRRQFSGLSSELDEALNTNLAESTQQAIQSKGYRRLENRNDQFVGDIQLGSVYKLFEDPKQSIVHQLMVSLPTGPAYDPDDLMALNTFHKTSFENTFGYARALTSVWKIIPHTTFKLTMPDQIEVRVPKDENDSLPDESTKETVQRIEGASAEIGIQNLVDLTDKWQVGLDYKFGTKGEDKFTAARGQRYDLLGKNTISNWQKVSASFVYSTVKTYLSKKSFIPLNLSLNLFDTIAGRNVERQSGQEATLTLFF